MLIFFLSSSLSSCFKIAWLFLLFCSLLMRIGASLSRTFCVCELQLNSYHAFFFSTFLLLHRSSCPMNPLCVVAGRELGWVAVAGAGAFGAFLRGTKRPGRRRVGFLPVDAATGPRRRRLRSAPSSAFRRRRPRADEGPGFERGASTVWVLVRHRAYRGGCLRGALSAPPGQRGGLVREA